jgi:hypothetical protein
VLTLLKLKVYFKRKDGFVATSHDTGVKTTFCWREAIAISDTVFV